jgi:hypothetical protein
VPTSKFSNGECDSLVDRPLGGSGTCQAK